MLCENGDAKDKKRGFALRSVARLANTEKDHKKRKGGKKKKKTFAKFDETLLGHALPGSFQSLEKKKKRGGREGTGNA